ncbi:MAG: LiaF transmembrane domain-containing protein [Candidatus Zhuqueibacterota bacterium]
MIFKTRQFTIGISIIVIGLFVLLTNLQVISFDSQFYWGLAFLLLGVVSLNIFSLNTVRRGRLIFGIILIIIGLLMILDSLNFVPDGVQSALFFWAGAALFIAFYIRNNRHWWSIIPGGLFIIFGTLTILEDSRLFEDDMLWVVFLAGLSLIFWFLYLIKDEANQLDWTIRPALVFTIITVTVMFLTWTDQFEALWFPVAVILLGGYLVISKFISGSNDKPPHSDVPPTNS